MSGSPVIQNGRIVGAVTHVLVNNPERGYGIFIANMLDAASKSPEVKHRKSPLPVLCTRILRLSFWMNRRRRWIRLRKLKSTPNSMILSATRQQSILVTVCRVAASVIISWSLTKAQWFSMEITTACWQKKAGNITSCGMHKLSIMRKNKKSTQKGAFLLLSQHIHSGVQDIFVVRNINIHIHAVVACVLIRTFPIMSGNTDV